jgi:alpha-L-fucosidase
VSPFRINDKVKSVSKLVDNWYHSVEMNSNFLLNLPPDRRGLIHENDISTLIELKKYLDEQKMRHIRSKTYHPMTQGKIERYFRSMKNLILLDLYYSPEELRTRICEWVDYYNNHRYHEAIDNVTPSDMYFGRDKEILKNRMKIKKQTIQERKKINKMIMLDSLSNGIN